MKDTNAMDEINQEAGGSGKRSDVGYGRPPPEHRFKKGQKPPARKKKDKPTKVQLREVLRKVLQERHRVVLNGKTRWVSAVELVLRRAYQEAEKGNATLRRELTTLLFSSEERGAEPAMLVIADPTAPSSATGLQLRTVDAAKGGKR